MYANSSAPKVQGLVKDALPEPPDGFHHKIPFPYGEATQLERE